MDEAIGLDPLEHVLPADRGQESAMVANQVQLGDRGDRGRRELRADRAGQRLRLVGPRRGWFAAGQRVYVAITTTAQAGPPDLLAIITIGLDLDRTSVLLRACHRKHSPTHAPNEFLFCCQEALLGCVRVGSEAVGVAAERTLVAGPGVACPKSRCSGCEPAAPDAESFPGCPPGPAAVLVVLVRRASAWSWR